MVGNWWLVGVVGGWWLVAVDGCWRCWRRLAVGGWRLVMCSALLFCSSLRRSAQIGADLRRSVVPSERAGADWWAGIPRSPLRLRCCVNCPEGRPLPTPHWPWPRHRCGPGPPPPLRDAAPPPPDASGHVIRALGPTGWFCSWWELRVVRSQRRLARPVLRHPLQLKVKDRPFEGAMGQLGAAVDADVHLRPKSLLGVALELRILVHRQTQLCRVVPDSHEGALGRGQRA